MFKPIKEVKEMDNCIIITRDDEYKCNISEEEKFAFEILRNSLEKLPLEEKYEYKEILRSTKPGGVVVYRKLEK